MKGKVVDCFMLMGSALSLRGDQKLPEMGRPILQEVFTTYVNVSLTIQSFNITSVQNMNVELIGLLNQRWMDPRLGANIKTRKMAVSGQIWKPKITNINGQNTLCNNDDTIFWRGYGDEGNVLLSEKIQIQNSCSQDFQKFPFDVQHCYFQFGSYRFPIQEVSLIWENFVITDKEFVLNDFVLSNISNAVEMDSRPSGNFSVVSIRFTIKRQYLHYVFTVFTPCIVLNLINYMSLWYQINSRSLRFQLQVFSFCGLLCFYYYSTSILLPVSYLKAMDLFVTTAMIFSTILLIESFCINSICSSQENLYHLSKHARSFEYPRCVNVVELVLKVAYPVFYIFALVVFTALYTE